MSNLQSYLSDFAITALFGVGYYLFRNKKPLNQNDTKQTARDALLCSIEMFTNLDDFNSFIEQSSPNSISDPLKLLSYMVSKGVSPNISTYNNLIQYCLISENQEKCYEFLKEEMLDPLGPVTPDSTTLQYIAKGLHSKVMKEKEHIDTNDINSSKISLHSRQTHDSDYSSKGPYKEIHEHFSEQVSSTIKDFLKRGIIITVIALNIILDCLSIQNRFHAAFDFYNNFKDKIKPDAKTFNILLKIIKEKGTPDINYDLSHEAQKINKGLLIKAFSLMQEAVMRKLIDETFIKSLIDICIEFNDYAKAEELMTTLKFNFPHLLSEDSYISMMKAYAKKEDLDAVIQTFEEMKIDFYGKNKELSAVNSYICLINCCVRCKNLEKAEMYYKEFNSIEKNSHHLISSMILAYKHTKKYNKAHEMFESLISNNIKSTIVYNSMIDCCVENGKYERMNEIFNSMKPFDLSNNYDSNLSTDEESNDHRIQSSYSKDIQADLISYSLILKGYARANNIAKVKEIYSLLKKREDFQIQESLYNVILDSFARNKYEEGCIEVFNDMKNSNSTMSVMTYGIMIKLYVNLEDNKKVLRYFKEIIKPNRYKIKPSIVIYQLVLKSLVKKGEIEEAILQFKQMIVQKLVKPDSLIFELVMKSCIEHQRIEDAFELFEHACYLQIRLEQFLVTMLLEMLDKNKDLCKLKKNKLVIELIRSIKVCGLKINNENASKINSTLDEITQPFNNIHRRESRCNKVELELINFEDKVDLEKEINIDFLKVRRITTDDILVNSNDNKDKKEKKQETSKKIEVKAPQPRKSQNYYGAPTANYSTHNQSNVSNYQSSNCYETKKGKNVNWSNNRQCAPMHRPSGNQGNKQVSIYDI